MVRRLVVFCAFAAMALGVGAATGGAATAGDDVHLSPGNLLISRSVYDNNAKNVVPGMVLPPNCVSGCGLATADGSYPFVWNNDLADSSFGITSKIFLDQVTPSGSLLGSIEVPNSSPTTLRKSLGDPSGNDSRGGDPGDASASREQLVTSFPSKSELALNLSTSGDAVTFMGYLAPVDAIDVSNSNTPGVLDPTNPVSSAFYRVVAELDTRGRFHFTKTNAYSGNNGRAAILNDDAHANVIYTVGNAGNGGNPQPDGVIVGAGAQILTPELRPEFAQRPGAPTPVASFNITQLGDPADKIGKDTNFRGMTIFDHVLYYTKGSGGNGVNTVYFVDTTGKACPNGAGLPQAGASLPTSPLAYDPSQLQTNGLQPNNMCILKGFPTALKSKTFFPFGIWFANATTLYVADEGNGDNTFAATGTYTKAAAQTTAGLQKWVFAAGTWTLAYTLQAGLNLGQAYTVAGYPTGTNPATGLPWSPASDGLRNVTGRLNRDGTASIWAVTSTVSGNGDQGADPNKVVAITDDLHATTRPSSESFSTIEAADFGEVLRGVSFTPGTETDEHHH